MGSRAAGAAHAGEYLGARRLPSVPLPVTVCNGPCPGLRRGRRAARWGGDARAVRRWGGLGGRGGGRRFWYRGPADPLPLLRQVGRWGEPPTPGWETPWGAIVPEEPPGEGRRGARAGTRLREAACRKNKDYIVCNSARGFRVVCGVCRAKGLKCSQSSAKSRLKEGGEKVESR